MTTDNKPPNPSKLDRALASFHDLEAEDRVLFLEQARRDGSLRRESITPPEPEGAVDIDVFLALDALTTDDQPPLPWIDRGRESFKPGMRVGAYRLERMLGAGGAGQVFLAQRDDDAYKKRVAIKVLRRGMDSDELVRRFRGERQILARLEHPHIAKLLDGGTTEDGRPFLVMEYVDGVSITRWCEQENLDLRSRVELFLTVCEAVQFAHRNLIVHRDLKPDNILVSKDGDVALLDFGIAKLLDPETFPGTIVRTDPGWRPMTPEYASPEQVLGAPITTASDVYSLGVVLFELLVGRRPYEIARRTPSAIEKVVCHEEPPQASKMATSTLPDRRRARELAGDLDDILAMALEKSPQERYTSVQRLADDLRAFLGGLPVSARRSSAFYRTTKFVRRHRWGVGVAALMLSMVLVFSATLWQQRGDILRQRDRAEEISTFLIELFTVPDPYEGQGESVTAREILDKGAREAEARLGDRPGILGDIFATIGATYYGLALYDQAEPLVQRALQLKAETYGPDDPSVASTLSQLVDIDIEKDRLQEAEQRIKRVLALQVEHYGEPHESVIESRLTLAKIHELTGQEFAAEELYLRAEAEARRIGSPELLIKCLTILGTLYPGLDQHERGRAYLLEAQVNVAELWGENHPEMAVILNRRGMLEMQSRPEEAERQLRRALSIHRSFYREPHPLELSILNNIGQTLHVRGQAGEAERVFREALEFANSFQPRRKTTETDILNGLARALNDQGKTVESERVARESLELHREVWGERHEATALALNNLSGFLVHRGELVEAEAVLTEAIEILLEVYGDGHSRVAASRNNLARILTRRGELKRAAALYDKVIADLEAISPNHPFLPNVLQNRAGMMDIAGDHEEAFELYQRALRTFEGLGQERTLRAGYLHINRLVSLIHMGRLEEAEIEGRRALEVIEEVQGPNTDDWLRARRVLASAIRRQGRFDEALALTTENLVLCRELEASPDTDPCAAHIEAHATAEKARDEAQGAPRLEP